MADPKDNLRMWPPGVSGNPKGRAKLTPEERQKQKWSKKFINSMINVYGQMSVDELQEAWNDPEIPGTEKLYIKTILDGLSKTKDAVHALEFLFKWTIGPPKEEKEFSWKPSIVELDNGRQLIFKRTEEIEE